MHWFGVCRDGRDGKAGSNQGCSKINAGADGFSDCWRGHAKHEFYMGLNLFCSCVTHRLEVANEGDQIGETGLTAIKPRAARVGKVRAAKTGLHTVKPVSYAARIPGVAGQETCIFRNSIPARC